MTLPIVFNGARLKVSRANQHIDELESVLNAFVDVNKTKIISKINSNTLQYIKFEALDPPEFIPAIVGDSAHNLRSALDHIAATITEKGGGNLMVSKFPTSNIPDAFKKAVATHIEPYSSEVAKALVDKLDKDHSWHKALYGIGALDNADKHRRLILAITKTGVEARGVQIGGAQIGKIISHNTSNLIIAPAGVPIHFQKKFEPTVKVVFGKGEPFETEAVVSTLRNATKFILDTIDICERVYAHQN